MTEVADVVVIGGGCVGASVALHLAEKAAGKVLLLEQKDLANGASGKGIGIVRTHYTHPTLAKLAQKSLSLFHDFEERFGGYSPGFHACGYYVLVGEGDVATLNQVVAMHQQMGIEVSLVDRAQVQSQVPLLDLSDVGAIAYEPHSGFGNPTQTTIALARRAADLGAEIRIHSPALEVQLDIEGRVAGVRTPTGTIATRTVVDCVGPWARKFAQPLGLDFPVTPIVEHVTVVERSGAIAPFHPIISDLVNLCYFRADANQPFTRIGNSDPSFHRQFALANADDFRGQLFPHICDDLHHRLIHRCPSLAQARRVETYSGVWGATPDYQPIIDRLDYVPGLFCAVGFSGHGYKLSPVIGDLVSRLVVHGKTDRTQDLHLFRFNRFQENDLVTPPLRYARAGGLR